MTALAPLRAAIDRSRAALDRSRVAAVVGSGLRHARTTAIARTTGRRLLTWTNSSRLGRTVVAVAGATAWATDRSRSGSIVAAGVRTAGASTVVDALVERADGRPTLDLSRTATVGRLLAVLDRAREGRSLSVRTGTALATASGRSPLRAAGYLAVGAVSAELLVGAALGSVDAAGYAVRVLGLAVVLVGLRVAGGDTFREPSGSGDGADDGDTAVGDRSLGTDEGDDDTDRAHESNGREE